MRRLVEWNARTNNSAATTPQANDLYKDRFMKLAKHIEDCYDWSTVYYVSEWELELEFRSGYAVFNLTIDVNSSNITVVVLDTKAGTERMTATVAHGEWSKLLDILKKNRIIQDPKLCECYDLPLHEWTYQQNTVQKSNASTTNDYTKKFRDMLEYHVQNFYSGHTHAKLLKHDIVKAAVNCFLYEEHVSLGGISHKFELAGAVSLTLGDWVVQGFKDGQMTSNQRGTKGFEEMFDYLRDSHLLVLPYNGTKEYKTLVENFKEKYEMKLHEEFKLVEDMWEDDDTFVDMYEPAESAVAHLTDLPAEAQKFAQKQQNKPLWPVLKTFGSKTYNLVKLQDMEAWVKANADFQFKRHPNSYTHTVVDKDDFTPTESHAKYIYITILNNLEKSLDFESMDSGSRRSVEKNLSTLRNKYYKAWMDRHDNASGRKQAVELYDKEFDEFIDKVLPGAAAGYKKQFKSALKDLWAEYNKRTDRGYAM